MIDILSLQELPGEEHNKPKPGGGGGFHSTISIIC